MWNVVGHNVILKNIVISFVAGSATEQPTHLFANVLHQELQLLGVVTLTVEQVPPQSCSQDAVIRQDSLQKHRNTLHSSAPTSGRAPGDKTQRSGTDFTFSSDLIVSKYGSVEGFSHGFQGLLPVDGVDLQHKQNHSSVLHRHTPSWVH